MAITVTTRTQIIELAVGMFNAAPGASVLSELVTSLGNGTIKQLASNLENAVFNGIYPTFLTSQEFAERLVNNLVGTEVAVADKASAATLIVAQLAAGASRSSAIVDAINGLKAVASTNTAWINGATAFANKVSVATYYTVDKQLSASTLAGLQSIIASVTSSAASVTTAKASVDSTGSAGLPFTLTTGIDTGAAFTGGAGDDTFTATHLTLNASDAFSGGAGTDTLVITDTGTAAFSTPGALVSGIEIVTVRSNNGSAAVSAVAAVNEVQSVTTAGAAVGTSTSFLGIATTVVAADLAATVGAKIVANKAAILAGTEAKNLGIIDMVSGATNDIIQLVFSSEKGNVAEIASSVTNNGSTFTVGTQVTAGAKGSSAVAAVGGTTVAAGTFVGATTFNSDNSTSAVTYTGLASTNQVNVIGNTVTANGNVSATWGSTVTSPVLNLVGGTTASSTAGTGTLTISAAGASKVTLTSSGAPLTSTGTLGTNTVLTPSVTGLATGTLDIQASSNLATTTSFTTNVKDITVSGTATSVTLGAGTAGTTAIVAANLETINASGLTAGGVTVALNTGLKSFIGGAGNDTVATAALTNTGVVVDAGAGTNTLIIAAATDLDTTTEAAIYKNFQTVRAAAGSYDASLVPSATAIQMTGAGTLSNLTATQAGAVQIRVDGAYTASLANSTGESDVLALTLGSGAGAATNISTGLVANGFETINIRANPLSTQAAGAGKTSTVAAFTADKVTTINLTGTAVVLSNIATAKAVTINGSALTGDGATTPAGLTVAGNAVAGSSVTGSNFADTFTLGTVGSTYNSGAGADTINSTVALLLTGGVYNTVNAGDGIDTLVITDGGGNAVTLTDNSFRNLSNLEKITVNSTTTAAISITTGGWFDKAFTTSGVELTGTTSTGVLTIDASTFTGNMKVTATTVGTAGTEGTITITTGAGNDTVVASNATAGGNGVISTGAGNDTITGGGDVDTITGGTGKDTITGGAGNDVFVFAAGDTGLPSATNFDTITDFAANAGDIINLGAYTIVTNTSATAGTASISAAGIATFQVADVTLAQRITATENGINAGGTATAGQTAVFQFGNDAYVFVSDGVDGVGANDRLIQLVGIDTTAVTSDTVTVSGAGVSFTLA